MSLLQASQESVHCIIRQAFHVINDTQFDFLEFVSRFQAQVSPALLCSSYCIVGTMLESLYSKIMVRP